RFAQFMDSAPVQLSGLAIAIGATIVSAVNGINSAFFKSVNKAGGFIDLQEKRDREIGKVLEQAKQGVDLDVLGAIEKSNTRYSEKLAARMNQFKAGSVYDKWRTIRPHQKLEVAMTTGAVGTLALGAVIAIASGRDTARERDELEVENKELQ